MATSQPLDEIKQLYFSATRTTIERDLARAVSLLKSLPTEDERQRAAVYMDGLSQMRSEWAPPRRPKSSGPSKAATPERRRLRR